MKLTDKRVLITGASSGIGKAFALRVSKDKCSVILAARSIDKLNEVKDMIEQNGSNAIVVPTDVTKESDVKNLFLTATQNGAVLDVVFDNAGLGFINPLTDLSTVQIKQMIDVNLWGMILVAKYSAEIMSKQRYGHLVMTSSLAGLITVPQWSVYVATKWAITGFADSIRYELKPLNVLVTTLHPGMVNTEFFAKDKANIDLSTIGDTISPNDVAEVLYEALFTKKQKILVPGMAKNYALLYKFMPGLVGKLIEKMEGDIEYHPDSSKVSESDFSYVKCVTCSDTKKE